MVSSISLSIDADLDKVSLIARAVRALCAEILHPDDVDAVELGLVEAINNVIKHGYGGQPGAPGQYGGGYGQPARKSRTGLIAGLLVLALLVVGVVLLFVFLGGSSVLDQGAVERDVAAQFQEREGVALDLTCPADMAVEADATYECTGRTEAGEDVTLQIAVTDEDSGAYTWTEPS